MWGVVFDLVTGWGNNEKLTYKSIDICLHVFLLVGVTELRCVHFTL